MPVDVSALPVQQPNTSTVRTYKRYDYPALKPIQRTMQLVSIKAFEDTRFPNPKYGNIKIRFTFLVLIPNAENAKTEKEQNKYLNMGHGAPLRLEVNPVVSPPRVNSATGSTIPASTLYEVLCVLLNDGQPLTDEQRGIISDAELAKWVEEQGGGMSLDAARPVYARYHLMQTLNDLEAARPQVLATPQKRVVQSGPNEGKEYNILKSIDALVADEDRLPDYRQYPDPRTADDDPDLLCQDCGTQIVGYENGKGEWIDNRNAAKHSLERYKAELCGLCIHARKMEAASSGVAA